MFERFTERARQVVVFAQEEARLLGHPHIGTEHLLLGLFREDEGVAAVALRSCDLALGPARAAVVRIAGTGAGTSTGQIPFTPRAKRTLELALREAVALGHNYIGTEHILLALTTSPDSFAARVLLESGVDEAALRDAVLRHVDRQVTRSPAGARRQQHAWEYRVEHAEHDAPVSADRLNTLGAEGWELAATLSNGDRTSLIFKRRKA